MRRMNVFVGPALGTIQMMMVSSQNVRLVTIVVLRVLRAQAGVLRACQGISCRVKDSVLNATLNVLNVRLSPLSAPSATMILPFLRTEHVV